MQNPVKDRIVKLREEIAQISEANRLYIQGSYRAQLEITNDAFKDCRKSLTNWWRSPTGKNYNVPLQNPL